MKSGLQSHSSAIDSFCHRGRLAVATAAGVVGLMTPSAWSASQTWRATPADATWAGTSNWGTTGTVTPPGNNTAAVTGDVATFNAALSGGTIGGASNPIVIDLNRAIGGITFDTANVGAYVIGSNAGNMLTLSNNSTYNTSTFSRSILMTSAVANSIVIAAPLKFVAASSTNGTFGFVNNAASSAVTLTLSGAITNNLSRPNVTILDGSNTGNNTISGVITNTTSGQTAPYLVKRGAGTWILTAANIFSGTSSTDTSGNAGVQVLDGVLSVRNNQALGTSGTANQLQVYVGNRSLTYTYNSTFTTTLSSTTGGTLDLATGITLDNGLSLNLSNGGTIRSTGTNATNGRINVSTIAAANASLTTVNASDVFTVGNEANDFTGGSATSVVRIAGPGTVLLNNASNYAGTVSVDNGALRLGSSTALGAATTANVTFGAASTGKLQLFGNSGTVIGLNTNATPGSAVVENGLAGTATLTVNNAAANTFAGTLQNGAAGTLALTKTGGGVLTLTGASTYSGATTLTTGTLLAANTTGSATGTSAVAVNSGAILAGTGTVSNVTVSSAGRVAPGNGGIGTLTTNTLTLAASSELDYDIASPASLDQINVTAANGLTINGGRLNINGGGAAFTTNGVYNLIGYAGTIGGTGALSLNTNNQDLANKSYTFGTSGTFVTLTIANSGVTPSNWVPDSNGLWSVPANWSNGVPYAPTAFASFGSAITAPRTVTVDGAYTVGTLAFNNPNAYTLAPDVGGGSITLDNGASGSFITDTAGSHFIQVPLTLTTNGATVTVAQAADTLTLSGAVGGTAGMTKSGVGKLALTGVNTYTGGTTLSSGTIQINTADSLGDAGGALTFGGGLLQLLADVTTTRNYQVSGASDALIDTNGSTLIQNGTIAPLAGGGGGVVKSGAGRLVLAGVNTYTGATTLNGGVVSVSADANLGAAPASATVGNVVINAATLQASAGFTLNANRGITLNAASSTIQVDTGTVAYAGVITGSGTLNLTGTGTLSVLGTSNYTGNTVVNGATLALNANGSATGSVSGSITLTNGGTLSAPSTSTSIFPGNNVAVAAGSTGTLNSGNTATTFGGLFTTGDASSVLNINGSVSLGAGNVKQFTSGFTGTVRLNTNAGLRFAATSNVGVGNGGDFATFDLASGSSIFTRNNSNISLGALTGTGALNQPTSAGNIATYSIGAKGISTQFDGTINGLSNVAKVGAGKLTVTGNNTYTGTTAVNAGTLVANNLTSALGTGTVSVNTGGTLAGTGTITAAVNVNNGGVITAGTGATVSDTPGTLTTTTGTQTWNGNGTTESAGGTYTWKFGVAGNDLIEASLLNIVASSTSKFTFRPLNAGSTVAPSTAYVIAHVGGLQVNGGTPIGTDLTSLFYLDLTGIGATDNEAGYSLSYVSDGGSGFNVQFQTTPEPTTAALFVLGAAPLLGRRRRTSVGRAAFQALTGRLPARAA